MTRRRPFGPKLAARFAPFALLLLLPGLVELHAPGSEHSEHSATGVSADSAVAYFPAAEHPNQPLHVESAQEAEHPPCPACLHRLETRGGAPVSRLECEALRAAGFWLDRRPLPRRAGLRSSAQGRAPPLLFV